MKKYVLAVSIFMMGLLAACKGPDGERAETLSSAAAIADEKEEGVDEETYKNLCQTFDYKDYFRNDRKYTGEKIQVDVTVSQVIEGDCRGYDASGNEYYVKDLREEEDKFRLLKDDRITVYGEYAGVGQVTRAVGDYKEDIFCIDARYMVLHEENGGQSGLAGQERIQLTADEIQIFEGTWWEQYGQRGYMSIDHLEDNLFEIIVNWPSGAAGDNQWTMTGYYDKASGYLNYDNCRMEEIYYGEDGKESVQLVYTDGTGKFILSLADGYLNWYDDKDEPGVSVCFEKYGGIEGDGYAEQSGGYICPESDIRLLTEDDVMGRSAEELRIARNEIYARYGRIFTSEDLQNYFNSCSWYMGTIPGNQFQESMLSDIERKNVAFLQEKQDEMEAAGDPAGYKDRGLAIEYPEAVPQLPGMYHYEDGKGNSVQLRIDSNGYFVTLYTKQASQGRSWWLECINDQGFWSGELSEDPDDISVECNNYGREMVFTNLTSGEKYEMGFAGKE